MTFSAYSEYKESGLEWLGTVPEHWSIAPLKFSASCNDTVLPDSTDDNYEIEYVEISDVNEVSGITGSAKYRFVDAPSRARRTLRHGDVLISTVRTYLRAIAPVVNPPENLIASTGFAVVRPRNGVLDGTFLGYLLRAEWWISEIIARSVGVSYPAINASDLISVDVPLPTWHEQTQIARFLDHETARIDALIEEQQRLIELLKEKRRAVISHAVTKGLDPTVTKKDSGVEWLGEVPSHWVVKPLKRLVEDGQSISYGIVQPGDHQHDGVPFIQTTNMSSGDFSLDSLQRTSPEIDASFPRSRLHGGEVILGIRATIGAAFVVSDALKHLNLSRGVARIECSKQILACYLVYFLCSRGAFEYWGLAKQGSTFSEVSIATVRELPITVPPLFEQKKIIGHLDQAIKRVDELILIAEQSMVLLKERRSALISAAVTGKIDVRSWQPPAKEPSRELAEEAV